MQLFASGVMRLLQGTTRPKPQESKKKRIDDIIAEAKLSPEGRAALLFAEEYLIPYNQNRNQDWVILEEDEERAGSFNPTTWQIKLNPKCTNVSLAETLIHEIQHGAWLKNPPTKKPKLAEGKYLFIKFALDDEVLAHFTQYMSFRYRRSVVYRDNANTLYALSSERMIAIAALLDPIMEKMLKEHGDLTKMEDKDRFLVNSKAKRAAFDELTKQFYEGDIGKNYRTRASNLYDKLLADPASARIFEDPPSAESTPILSHASRLTFHLPDLPKFTPPARSRE
ncbi:MAG: hypothetical protein LW855_08840 [Alphaproteobacteria bacterium]|nr:hypothetical protein [Alphaproteobacteria bacterium]